MNSHPKELQSGGKSLDLRPNRFGWLRESNDVREDFVALRSRMDEDGYVFIRGFFDRADVAQVRLSIATVLNDDGLLDPSSPIEDCVSRGERTYFRSDIANSNAKLHELIYSEPVMEFYAGLLEGDPMHYDYTWLRTVAPGQGTSPHCDIVYMGRGTQRLFTAWVPLGDVPLEVGGLIVLEGSHQDRIKLGRYTEMDVDTACTNQDRVSELNAEGFAGFGVLTFDPNEIAERLDRRWLTAKFQMGDLLTFSVFTVHASLDNRSNQIRLSSDSRYQLASEPVDERWVGENPPAHGGKMIKEMIC